MSNQFWIEGKFYDWHLAKDLLKSNLFKENWQLEALRFIQAWIDNHNTTFLQTTSGSTGKPKTIRLTRAQMTYSATTTLNFLKLPLHSQFLLCLNTQFIGAKMMIVRAILNCGTLYIIPPTSQLHSFFIGENFFLKKDKDKEDLKTFFAPKIDLLAVVPAQFQRLLQHTDKIIWENIRNILVGGAALQIPYPVFLSQFSTKIYMSYGMSETASHIAISRFDASFNPHQPVQFDTIGEVEIKTGKKENLRIKGIVSNHNWIDTTDWVKIIHPNAFEWLGRLDFMINSGGVKIAPEQLENQFKQCYISTSLHKKFQNLKLAITSLSDEKWGEMPVLILESYGNKDNNEQLYRFCNTIVQKLKQITNKEKEYIGVKALKTMMIIDAIPYTENGKLNRHLLQNQINQHVINAKESNLSTSNELNKPIESIEFYPNNQLLRL